MKEWRIYIVGFDLSDNTESDEEFMKKAELQGTVYSLKGFQDQFNEGIRPPCLNPDLDYIRFIEVETYS